MDKIKGVGLGIIMDVLIELPPEKKLEIIKSLEEI